MTRGDVDNYAQTIGVVRDRSYFDKYDHNEVEDLQLARQNESMINFDKSIGNGSQLSNGSTTTIGVTPMRFFYPT